MADLALRAAILAARKAESPDAVIWLDGRHHVTWDEYFDMLDANGDMPWQVDPVPAS